jgi:hypothetical protein
MPLIYTVECSACGHQRDVSESHAQLQLHDGTFVELEHPGEWRDLERAGFSWEQAHKEARLIGGSFCICRRCGNLYERRSRWYAEGCTIGVLASGEVIIAIGLAFALKTFPEEAIVWLPASGVFLGLGVLIYWGDRIEKRRFQANSESRRPIADRICCEQWTPSSLVPIEEAEKKGPFPCPACGSLSVMVSCTGIS